MLALNNQIIKRSLLETIQNNGKNVKLINEEIDELYNYTDLLEIENIKEISYINRKSNILYYLKAYESIINTNDFDFCKCPVCKHDNCMTYHKTYQRNIIFNINKYEISAKISIVVLECSFCKNDKKQTQHYHALLPDFIFPYHVYSSMIILETMMDKYINHLKLVHILEQRRISQQLFYKWIRGLKQYLLSSSIILEIKPSIKDVLEKINNNIDLFLYQFYSQYHHPYFLFKITCVPLALMP